MALFKDFTFDGENSKDYGVYISGEAVYDAPERAMDMVQIPGRNGALALDNGYYNNIPVTYPAGCFADDQADFAAKLSRIRNMLASRHRYCRLEDAYYPDHFRMALYKSGLDVAPVARNKAGRFNIIFDAKPQRFLKSGEIVQELDADAPPTTSYGPADIVTFEGEPGDAIVHGQLSLEPIQDLHGYGNPYPAGGGKNLLPITLDGLKAINTSASWSDNSFTNRGVTYTVYTDEGGNVTGINVNGTASGGNSYLRLVPNTFDIVAGTILTGTPSGGSTNICIQVYQSNDSTSIGRDTGSGLTLNSAWSDVNMYIRVASGAAPSNLVFKPMLRLATDTDPTFAPYSNICPISGHTGANISVTGVNIWDGLWDVGSINGSTGQNASDGNAFRSQGYISVVPSANYYFYTNITGLTGSAARVFFYDADNNFISYQNVSTTPQFTTPENARYIRFKISVAHQDSYEVSINYPSTDTAYHAYNGTTYPISLGSTVYGGTLNVKTGVLTITKAYMETNEDGEMVVYYPSGTVSSARTWTFSSPYAYINIGSDIFVPVASQTETAGLCNQYKEVSKATPTASDEDVFTFRVSETLRRFCFRDTSIPDWNVGANNSEKAAKVKAYWAAQYALGNKLQVVFEIQTPYTVQLTPTEVTTLLGQNNIWADTGTTTITVQSPYELENPTLYPSKPLIRVYGSGTFQVNNITITVAEHSGYIDIDCDMMDCHRGADNMNQYVSFSGNDFPELQPGINRILLNGPDKVEITPRWWEL